MSKSSGEAPNATLYQLQQPEKLRNVLEQDKPDDCLSCRLTGRFCYSPTVSFSPSMGRRQMLIGNHRSNGIYWPRRLQLLLGHLSATKATGCHTEEQVNVWHEVTTGWYCGYCGSIWGNGLLAAGQLVFTVWTRVGSSTLEAVILEVSATSAARSLCNTARRKRLDEHVRERHSLARVSNSRCTPGQEYAMPA